MLASREVASSTHPFGMRLGLASSSAWSSKSRTTAQPSDPQRTNSALAKGFCFFELSLGLRRKATADEQAPTSSRYTLPERGAAAAEAAAAAAGAEAAAAADGDWLADEDWLADGAELEGPVPVFAFFFGWMEGADMDASCRGDDQRCDDSRGTGRLACTGAMEVVSERRERREQQQRSSSYAEAAASERRSEFRVQPACYVSCVLPAYSLTLCEDLVTSSAN